MAVAFDQIPRTIRIPGVYVELASGQSGGAEIAFRSLIIGQRLASGVAVVGVPRLVASVGDARREFGAGSMVEQMVAAFRRNNTLGELWAVGIDDAAGATQTEITLTVGGAATAAGTIALYVAGRRIAIGISGATTTALIAAAINTALISLGTVLPITSAVVGSVVTVTARNGGVASDLDVRVNYGPDDAFPPGVAIAIATSVQGATDPDVDSVLDALTEEKYDVIAHPYNADASMDALETDLDTRWGPLLSVDGLAITGLRGSASAATTYGNARNSAYTVVMDISTSPTSVPAWAAEIAGAVAASAEIDPARPLQTLPLRGVLAPPTADVRTTTEANTLLSDGIATHTVDADGTVRIQRLVTTYQTFLGVPDRAYMDAETVLTISYLRADLRQTFQRKFPRFKLANDGTRFEPGQPVMTPNVARLETIARFRAWEGRALVEDADAFKAALVTERDADDPDRLNIGLHPDLVNQLRVVAGRLTFLR